MEVNPERKTSWDMLRRSFMIFVAAIIMMVLAFLATLAFSLYESGRNNAVSMSAALEQFVGRSLEVSEFAARDALNYLERRGSVEGLVQDREAHAHFAELADAMSITEGMIFVDRDGTVVLHSGSFPAVPVDLSDRDWFRAHVEGVDNFIDGSFVSRVTETLLFVNTFAMRDDDGELLGVVNIGIPSDAILSERIRPLDAEGVVTEVFKESGGVIARDPFPKDLIGARVAVPDQAQEGKALLESGETAGLSLAAYSLLPAYGLVAAVRVPLSVVLQPLMVTAAIALPLLALLVIGALVTVRRFQSQEKRLGLSAARLETVLHASNLGAWQWLPQTNRTEYLGRWAAMLGYKAEELEPCKPIWEDLLHPDERAFLVDSFARLLTGETDEFYQEHRMKHKAGHWIWVLNSCRVVERDRAGNPVIVIGIHFDISDRRDAEERMRAISLEVDHRSKNLLAVVQSLVSMTKSPDTKTFKSILHGRIQALAQAHDLLSRSRWRGVDLRAIAEQELSPFRSGHADHIEIEGPELVLNASSIQAVAMTLHELATNAAKYGSLSVPGGTLSLTWRFLRDTSEFEILWEEHAAQVTQEDEPTSGFGSKLIHLMVESQLEGTVETKILDQGFRCRMRLPAALILRHSMDQSGPAEGDAPLLEGQAKNGGLRMLLVEDEAMLAAEIAQHLESAGHRIEASASRLSDATRIAVGLNADAAVLDINLHGELTFPVADILRERGIPFIFVTGYQHEGLIPDRFQTSPVVTKPIAPDTLQTALAKAVARQALETGDAEAVC